MVKEKEVKAKTESKEAFTKEELVKSKRFSGKADLLNAILDGHDKYTIAEVEKRIDGFLKGTVE